MKQAIFSTQVTLYFIKVFFLFLVSSLWASSAFALDLSNISVSTMITNFAASIPNLMSLVTAIAYVLGMYMVVQGIVQLKKYGDQRTQMSTEHSLKGPLIVIAVGAALLYLPTSVQQGFTTFWSDPAPYAYQTSESGPFKEFIDACFLIVQFIGTIYFIKGLTMMTHLGPNTQQGGFSRALTHIIGGIFCIDLYDFLNTIFVTLGLGTM